MRWSKRVGNLSQPKATSLLGKQSVPNTLRTNLGAISDGGLGFVWDFSGDCYCCRSGCCLSCPVHNLWFQPPTLNSVWVSGARRSPIPIINKLFEKRTEICDVIAFGFSPFVESPSEFSTLGKRKTLKTVNGASPLRVDRFFSWQKGSRGAERFSNIN